MTVATDAPASPTPPAPRKSSLGKKILKLFLVLFVLFIIALVILFLNLNTLIAMGVVRGGKYATDQDTALKAANLSFSNGTLALNEMEINNLPGYTSPKILMMKSCSTTVESG